MYKYEQIREGYFKGNFLVKEETEDEKSILADLGTTRTRIFSCEEEAEGQVFLLNAQL